MRPFYKAHFWDGRAPGLEAQATGPIQNPIEMAQDLDELVKELSEVPGYVERFQSVFGTGVTKRWHCDGTCLVRAYRAWWRFPVRSVQSWR